MDKLVCVQDFENEALAKLDRNAGNYYKSGSDDEITLARNLSSYNRWLIRPRMLIDVSKRNLKKTVLGKPVSFPIGFSPCGFQCLAHPEGEVSSAQAACGLGSIFVLSTYATRSIEEIGKACPNGRKWFQLFPNTQEHVSIDMVKRAERAGFEAVVVTLDAQFFGNKRVTAREGLTFPPQLRLGNLVDYVETSGTASDDDVTNVSEHVCRTLANNLTWDLVSRLRKHTKLPIILKGILTTEDATIAVQHNVDGIWISNHGGRQIDTAPQPIDVLPEISAVVQGKCEIYIDSGVRRGSDAFKAMALGATMAFVGRPQIWGIAVAGADGATRVLEILREELDLTLALSGVADVNNITKDAVCRFDAFAKL
ncbi:Hydroxyacid oxidase 1 [Orchesella cincta]|uniref:(S)-2-hydroxy-acid oxidase n=1 Tax=Orchesella cincta TaxID=48709 RepID=A0A1D2MN47_ORCCI|nr:Hydroxyacid oxidase 1 [Orchesella cincta]